MSVVTTRGSQGVGRGLALLGGVRVVDFTQALSGPYATMMLGDLGADVIKVEAPGRGDDSRHWGPPFLGDDAAYFMAVNRNKRSVALDLKQSAGLRSAQKLIATADVLVENWRPGTAERLQLGSEDLRALNPGLITCSISGYGQDGDARAGYDQIVQGTSAVMSITGPEGHPTKWGVPAGDISAGMFAATAIAAALYARRSSGAGCQVDVSMQDCLVSMLTHHASRFLATGVMPPNDHNSHSAIAPYGLFDVRDGCVNICVGNDAQFERMCMALELPALLNDRRFGTNANRVANRGGLLEVLMPRLLELSAEEVVDRLELAGIPVGLVNDLATVLSDSETVRRQMILELKDDEYGPVKVVNSPWKVDGHAAGVHRTPPRLGEHTDEILNEVEGRASREG